MDGGFWLNCVSDYHSQPSHRCSVSKTETAQTLAFLANKFGHIILGL